MSYHFTNKSIPNFLIYLTFSIVFSTAIYPIFVFTIGLQILFTLGQTGLIAFNILYFLVCFYLLFTICRKNYLSNSYLNLEEKVKIRHINFWNKVVQTSVNWEEVYKIELFYRRKNSWISNLIFRQKKVSGYNFMIFTNSEEIHIPQEIWQNSKKVKEIIQVFENIKQTRNLKFRIEIDKWFFFFLRFGQIVLGIILLLFIIFVAIYFADFLKLRM